MEVTPFTRSSVMSNIQIFESPEFGQMTVIVIDGKEHFEAVPCAKKLGYTNPRDAVLRHCHNSRKHAVAVETGKKADGTPAIQMIEKTFIPEGDLYRLIIRSNLPDAVKFEQWVCDEVLPTIRGTGTPATAPQTGIDLVFAGYGEALKLIERLQQTIAQQSALLQEAAPKIAFYDVFMRRNILCHFQELENVLHQNGIDIGQNRLIQDFRKAGDIHAGNTLFTQKALDRGIGQNIQTGSCMWHGAVHISFRAFLHYKGVCAVFDRYKLTRELREAVFRDLTANDEPLPAKIGSQHSVGKCCEAQSQYQNNDEELFS